MEDPGTLWLLHWWLLAPPSRLPIWWLAFNEFHAVEFTDEGLEMAIRTQLDALADWADPHPSSIKKDISALLRTYAPAERSRRASIDDLLDCPLRELNLIGRSPATGHHRFTLGPKASLPPAIVTYAALDYVARVGTGGNTVTLSRLAHEPGGPGHIFKLTESELLAAIEPIVATTQPLGFASPTGVSQLMWSREPAEIAVGVLDDYFGSSAAEIRAGRDGDEPIDDELLEELGVGRDATDSVARLHATTPLSVGISR
jgi:hypothetical protein